MAKQKAKVIVAIMATAKASNYMRWMFVKNKTDNWSLPIFKVGFFDDHPIKRAVDSCLDMFGDISNISLSFKVSGETCIAMIYCCEFKFEKTFTPTGEYIEAAWQNPQKFINQHAIDDTSREIIEMIVAAKLHQNTNEPTTSQV